MPSTVALPGFLMSRQQRIETLIMAVDGPVRAAALAKKNRGTIDNWRKEGADPPIWGLLPLCEDAKLSLDWVATGYQVRPDLAAAAGRAAEYVPLMPLVDGADAPVAPITASFSWLATLGVEPGTARLVYAGDDGMSPVITKGAMLLIDTAPSKTRSGIYALRAGEEHLARRLVMKPENSELLADAMPSWRYPAPDEADGRKLARIVWVGQAI